MGLIEGWETSATRDAGGRTRFGPADRVERGVGASAGLLRPAAAIMRAVPATEIAAAHSFNTLMHQLGTSTATAVAAAVSGALVVQADGHLLRGLGLDDHLPRRRALVALVVAARTPAPHAAETRTEVDVPAVTAGSPWRRVD
jgi:hypothetical protein